MDHLSQLKETLEREGWLFSTQPIDTGVNWYAYRTLRHAVDCAHNSNPPVITITPYSLGPYANVCPSVEIAVGGELPSGRWVYLKEYGIRATEVMDVLDAVEHTLSVAWNAGAMSEHKRSDW